MFIFFNETDFTLPYKKNTLKRWVKAIATSENRKVGAINYIFCDDDYLHRINVQYLAHDTLTDIITFDYCQGDTLHSDIYISIERVRENATDYGVPFEQELLRVLSHGILHLCGYKDKTPADSTQMRFKEEEKIKLFSE